MCVLDLLLLVKKQSARFGAIMKNFGENSLLVYLTYD